MSPQFWLNLQNRYDLEMTEDLLEGRLDDELHSLMREKVDGLYQFIRGDG
jgi:plasmid maintenance system antidote protein VapI